MKKLTCFIARIAFVSVMIGYASGCRNLRHKAEPAAGNTNVTVSAIQAAGDSLVSNATGSAAAQAEIDLLSNQSRIMFADANIKAGETNGVLLSVTNKLPGASRSFMPGNKILIQVWMRDNITQMSGYPVEIDVPESGRLFFPHIGLTQVEGRDATEIQAELQTKFTKILTQVTVLVIRKQDLISAASTAAVAAAVTAALPEAERPFKVVILGRVSKPGVYTLAPGTRLRELLGDAGDISRYGHSKVYVVRGSTDKPEVFRVEMTDIYKGIDLSGNIALCTHDAVYVDAKLLWKISDFMSLLLSPILQIRDTLFVYDRFFERQ